MEQHESPHAGATDAAGTAGTACAFRDTTKDGALVRESTPLQARATNLHRPSRMETARQKISECRFYLDSMDEQLEKGIKNRLKLLGSSYDAFFSNKCTHLITTKPHTDQALGSSKPDPIVAKALQWKLKIMAPEKLSRLLQQIVNSHTSGHRSNRLQQHQQHAAEAAVAAAAVGSVLNGPANLAALMEHEKRYGVGTSRGGSIERPPPQFIPFKHRYLLVEDATQVHRPLVIKEYMAVNDVCYWPYIKNTPAHKSPFAAMPAVSSEKMAEQRLQKHKQEIKIATGETTPAAPTGAPAAGPGPAAPASAPAPATIATKAVAAAPIIETKSPFHSSNFKPSGIQPSMTTTPQTIATTALTPTTTTNITIPTSRLSKAGLERVPPDENVARLDRRMVDSSAPRLRSTATLNNINKRQTRDVSAKLQDDAARMHAYYARKKAEQEMRWCEICNKRYNDLKDHVQEKGHQAYVKDKNNFNGLDSILMTVRRKYKSPLPLYMKNTIDPDIDGSDVQFENNTKIKNPVKRPIEYMDIDEDLPAKRHTTPSSLAYR
ncbi:hypothetical protein BX666DRAFT_1934597 [Dichotomocladium elegans]|nr:hypothetical protein BX666DRAFT_1934597 [Dichotomocladium elegans]